MRGMKLIIAEKPELGRAIADALPGAPRTERAVVYKGEYAVVWAYGHLLTLKEPEDYDPGYKRWSLSQLPIFFPDWGQKPNEQGGGRTSKKERLQQIGELLKKSECVIHAGDPDDEGQYLIDEILRWHHYQGPVWRMNTNDTTPAALRRALEKLTDNRASENRGWSAHARTVADMLVGYNCSRYFTLKNPGALLTIGRVQTATLGLVVMRDAAVERHTKRNYYELTAALALAGQTVEAKYEPKKDDPNLEDGRILDRSYAAEKEAMLLREKTLEKVQVRFQEQTEQPPLPFNLTELQSYCSSRFGYEPTEVLNITQSLRDRHGAITYNRSDCQYLSEEQYKGAPETMQTVIANIHYRPKELDMTLRSRCFDESRLSAHTAIIPQNKAIDLDRLTEPERKVYLAICKYYMAQFLPPAQKGRTSLTAPLPDGGTLKASSTVIEKPGYLALFKGDRAAKLEEGGAGPLSAVPPGSYTADVTGTRIDEKQTKPPPRYTKASLGKDMTRIARYVADPAVKKLLLAKDRDKEGENGSIGTVATRGPIIDKLVERGYFREEGKKLLSTPLGRELYRILPDELKKPDMTAFWWAIQEDIQSGKSAWSALTDSVMELIRRVVQTEYPGIDMDAVPPELRRGGKNESQEVLGRCPRCGGAVVEGKLGYGCSNYRSGCRFVIWKKSKMPMMARSMVSKTSVKTWLSGPWREDASGVRTSAQGVTFKQLVARSGDTFEAKLYLTDRPQSIYGPDFRLEKKKPENFAQIADADNVP